MHQGQSAAAPGMLGQNATTAPCQGGHSFSFITPLIPLSALALTLPPILPSQLMKAVRCLTSDHAVVTAIKESGTIPCLVPFLAKEKVGEVTPGAVLGSEVQLEALHALYNICNLNKRVSRAAAIDHFGCVENTGYSPVAIATLPTACFTYPAGPS